MMTPPFLRAGALCAAGFVLLPSIALWAADKPAAPAAEASVQLAPVRIDGARDYVPLEAGWQMAELPGFRVYSHNAGMAKAITRELQIVREALGLVWGDDRLLRQWVAVVVCADEAEFLRWTHVSPAAFDRLSRAVRTPSGVVLVFNGGNDTVHRAAGRAYVRALLDGTSLPSWLREGLASIINTAELDGDRLTVGKINFDPRDNQSWEELNNLSMATAFATTLDGEMMQGSTRLGNVNSRESGPLLGNRRGEAMEVTVNGMAPTLSELRGAVEEELQRRLERRATAQGDAEFSGYLRDSVVMDLDKLLDPKAEETVRWRMNAWAFTHLAMFGEKSQFRPALTAFVGKLQQAPAAPPVSFFKETFGESAGSFEMRMRQYAAGGKYEAMSFKLAEAFNPREPELAAMPESATLLLKARIFGATGHAEEARGFLQQGYADPANRTAGYVGTLAQAWREADQEKAIGLLEEAAKRKDGIDHHGRRLLAELRLEKLTAQSAKLDRPALSQVLDPLFAALNGGDTTEHLFVLIGRAWQASATPPTDGQLNALRMGLKYHPESASLQELMNGFGAKG